MSAPKPAVDVRPGAVGERVAHVLVAVMALEGALLRAWPAVWVAAALAVMCALRPGVTGLIDRWVGRTPAVADRRARATWAAVALAAGVAAAAGGAGREPWAWAATGVVVALSALAVIRPRRSADGERAADT